VNSDPAFFIRRCHSFQERGTRYAEIQAMMDVALSIMALVAGGVTLELFATARAPLGYQDESGFHFGPEPRPSEEANTGNPS
jgi:hypothetical protein